MISPNSWLREEKSSLVVETKNSARTLQHLKRSQTLLHQASNGRVVGNCRCDTHSCEDGNGETGNTLVGTHSPCSVVARRFPNWEDNQAMAAVAVSGLGQSFEMKYVLHQL